MEPADPLGLLSETRAMEAARLDSLKDEDGAWSRVEPAGRSGGRGRPWERRGDRKLDPRLSRGTVRGTWVWILLAFQSEPSPPRLQLMPRGGALFPLQVMVHSVS